MPGSLFEVTANSHAVERAWQRPQVGRRKSHLALLVAHC
jgi:hypothetical protein